MRQIIAISRCRSVLTVRLYDDAYGVGGRGAGLRTQGDQNHIHFAYVLYGRPLGPILTVVALQRRLHLHAAHVCKVMA